MIRNLLSAGIFCRQKNAMFCGAIPLLTGGYPCLLHKYVNQSPENGDGDNALLRQKHFRFYSTVFPPSSDFFNGGKLRDSLHLGGSRMTGICRMHSDPEISDLKHSDDREGLLSLDTLCGQSIQKISTNAFHRPKFVHPMAIVHPDAIFGEGVVIGPFCTVGPATKLGNRCQLHPGCHISGNTELGEGCVLLTGAVVGSDLPGRTVIGNNNFIGYHAVVGVKCQDMKYRDGDDCFLYIGDNNDIREHASIHRSSKPTDQTVIGDNNLIMGSCHIAHDCKLGNHNIFANGTLLGGHVVVQNHVHTGGAVAVHQFCHIGSFAFVAGGSVVTHDVPMYTMVAGDRAELRGLNLEGLRRRGFSDLEVKSIRRAYQKLFMCTDVNAGGLEERLVELEKNEELANVTAVILMVKSVRDSFKENRRGIVKFRNWTRD